jgi:hypothetical protein
MSLYANLISPPRERNNTVADQRTISGTHYIFEDSPEISLVMMYIFFEKESYVNECG